jgi:hypothetical protein
MSSGGIIVLGGGAGDVGVSLVASDVARRIGFLTAFPCLLSCRSASEPRSLRKLPTGQMDTARTATTFRSRRLSSSTTTATSARGSSRRPHHLHRSYCQRRIISRLEPRSAYGLEAAQRLTPRMTTSSVFAIPETKPRACFSRDTLCQMVVYAGKHATIGAMTKHPCTSEPTVE